MVTHHLTTISNIVLQDHTWSIPKTDIYRTQPHQLLWNRVKNSYSGCSMIITNVIWKSAHSIITSHSLSSHKITISNHPDSLNSCAMTQIWMLHDNPSISTISPNNQTTLSSWSIYHHAKLTSGLTISNSTWSDQGNDGKERQWYCSMIRRTRVVKSCNGIKGWCHVRLKMDRSSSPQSQSTNMDMYVDMVLL